MYEEICYRRNYLNEVICRLDFASNLTVFKNTMPRDIFLIVKKYYPVAEPQDIIGAELQISPGNTSVNNIVSKKWVFYSRDRKNRCSIDTESVIFSSEDYNIFEEFRGAVLDVLSIIMKSFQEIQGKRLGLRYINVLPLKEHESWINDKFFNALSEHKDENTTKLLTQFEYAINEKDVNVRLQYGYLNPDYPSVLKNEDFTIDIDAYSTGLIYLEDISKLLEDMHFEDQKCFETMITDRYRNEMNK